MFGSGSKELFERLPSLHELAPAEARRMLSAAFLDVQALTLQGERSEGPDERSLLDYLRRLANALESHAIFDRSQPDETARAAAFVAAESLSLLSERHRLSSLTTATPSSEYRLTAPACFTAIEAALLYLYAGFDANAASVAARIPPKRPQQATAEAQSAEWALEALTSLARLDPRQIPPSPENVPAGFFAQSPREALRAQLLNELGVASTDYLGWLAVAGKTTPIEVGNRLKRISDRLRAVGVPEHTDVPPELRLLSATTDHADIHHLVRLLSATIESTKERALRNVPAPSGHEAVYSDFLRRRALGVSSAPRPLVWPNAMRFVSECLPGPRKHSVVSVPTGAGKSFFAELAASQALLEGWVLYLVPTNALANQVAADLKTALRSFPSVSVRLFFGGQEYTTADGERVTHAQIGTVAVMTPEKCALALRLSPDAFHTCRLCIFDECHLISEAGRGALAELVLSHLLAMAPICSVMLMSAMMSNPEILANWLQSATGSEVTLIADPWRPTRTLRATVVVDHRRMRASQVEAMAMGRDAEAKRKKPLKRPKRYSFQAFHAVVANLQGAWTSEDASEYALMRLPTSIEGKTTTDGDYEFGAWVNGTAAQLATHFTSKDQQVLTFLAASKHHCFTVARQTIVAPQRSDRAPLSQHAKSLLAVAQMELGCESELATLIDRGVAVHTSALLDSERRAAEIAFREGSARAMFATGTLAQGLNLPAPIVVVGGTSIGGQQPDADDPDAEDHAKAQLLNAVGRAGRAGVASHGLALVVPNQPLEIDTVSQAPTIRRSVTFLGEEDSSSHIASRLLSLSVFGLENAGGLATATPDELVAISYLAARQEGTVSAEAILVKSLAFSRWSGSERPNAARRAAQALDGLEQVFLAQSGAPRWLSAACAKSGLPFLLMLRLHQALLRRPDVGSLSHAEATFSQWFDVIFDVLQLLPPAWAVELLGKKQSSDAVRRLWELDTNRDDPAWKPEPAWNDAWQALRMATAAYMAGKPLVEVANVLSGTRLPLNPGRSAPTAPIPRAISFTNQTVERLARAAGGISALLDAQRAEINNEDNDLLVEESEGVMALLPLAIRAGCNSLSTLAWYRFGIHLRRPAHLLSDLFPLEPGIVGDGLAEEWVREKRSEWLGQDEDILLARNDEEFALLHASRIILGG